ncbi:hypothetical protein DPMN_035609 [Dreissena polymorpha]|uniref:Uncharacterized protein n=1 Tax=Dreissena polymorpha TaxID=45954 RepID=A0A9D4M950_DREPO|nr:hypothetical protein DPMN_035609 [Dreissena polymorpha]
MEKNSMTIRRSKGLQSWCHSFPVPFMLSTTPSRTESMCMVKMLNNWQWKFFSGSSHTHVSGRTSRKPWQNWGWMMKCLCDMFSVGG